MKSASLALVLVLGLGVGVASATDIQPGFDFFETAPGASVDLSGLGLGVIPLQGAPLSPSLGSTDTIVERLQGISPCNPPGCSDVIDIEIVSLHLVSTAPVDLTPLGGPFVGVFADLHATIDKGGLWSLYQPDLLNPSVGLMNVFHSNVNGGSFDACWGNVVQCSAFGLPGLGQLGGGIFADGLFTIPGSTPGPLNTILSTPAPRLNLAQLNAPWLHVAGAGYPGNAVLPAGNFYPGWVNAANPQRVVLPHQGPHPVTPAVPEPSSALLLGAGLLGMLAVGRRLRI